MNAMSSAEYLRFLEAYLRVMRVRNQKARFALHTYFYCVKLIIDEGEADILKVLEEAYKAYSKDIKDDAEALAIFENYLEDSGLLVKPSLR